MHLVFVSANTAITHIAPGTLWAVRWTSQIGGAGTRLTRGWITIYARNVYEAETKMAMFSYF